MMTLNRSTVLQVLAWGAAMSALAIDSQMVPEKYKALVAFFAASLSLTLHRIAGGSNPDGTPAEVPYDRPRK